jgi:hypothetical protein
MGQKIARFKSQTIMNKYNIFVAAAIQLVFFTIFFYIDAKNTVEPLWKNVLSFGLNPLVLVFYALTPIMIWWTYRVFYQFAKEQFWYAGFMHSLIVQVAYVGSSYLATRQALSPRNWVSLALGLLAVIVSA